MARSASPWSKVSCQSVRFGQQLIRLFVGQSASRHLRECSPVQDLASDVSEQSETRPHHPRSQTHAGDPDLLELFQGWGRSSGDDVDRGVNVADQPPHRGPVEITHIRNEDAISPRFHIGSTTFNRVAQSSGAIVIWKEKCVGAGVDDRMEFRLVRPLANGDDLLALKCEVVKAAVPGLRCCLRCSTPRHPQPGPLWPTERPHPPFPRNPPRCRR